MNENLNADKKYLTEMQCGANFAYVLLDSNDFLSTDYKILQGYSDEVLIKCMKMQLNGRIQLYYLTKAYKPLNAIRNNLNADSMLLVVKGFLSGVLEVKNNGFLSMRNLDISLDKVFVNPNTFKIGLIYIPVSRHLFEDDAEFEKTFRSVLAGFIEANRFALNDKTYQISQDLKNTSLELDNILKRVESGIEDIRTVNQGLKTNAQVKPNNSLSMRLVAINVPSVFELKIGERDFVIGKKETNDGVVLFSKTISRVHCKVTFKDGLYYITDLNSTNGTFVNAKRVLPDQPAVLNNGDIVRLADLGFRVIIERVGV